MTANTTFVSGAILTAAQMNALPWGVVDTTAGGTTSRGFVVKTNSFSIPIVGSIAQITDFTMTFTPVTGRLYKASYTINLSSTTAQIIYTQFRIGATIYGSRGDNVVASGLNTVHNDYVFKGLTASTTIQVFAGANTTATATTVVGSNTEAVIFAIEDIGPA